MRVCHVITRPELGGAQLSTLQLLSRLEHERYYISVITSPKGILSRRFKDLKNVRTIFSPFLTRPINPILDILAFIHIYHIYKRDNYTIIHTHSSKAGIIGRWAAMLAGIPIVIHTVHGWSFNDYQPILLKRLFIFIERMTARFTTRIICVSRKDIEVGLKHKICPREKFVFIKYGIELDKFRKSSLDIAKKKKALGINNTDPVVGMISCLKPQKSPMDYLKASIEIYRDMPNINFLLVGDGILKKRCKNFLSKSSLNGRFIFAGWRMDVPQILDVLDIVVLTSKWEGMPISLIEALCKGCPVIATNVGGIPELVKEGITGYLVSPGSYGEIAKKVSELINNKEALDNIKKEAILSIDDTFSVNRMITEMDCLYRELSGNTALR